MRQIHLMLRGRAGILYWWDKAGEGLPMHHHREAPELEHDVLVTSGRIELTVGDYPPLVLAEGEYRALPRGVPHQIVALEDGSSFIGVYQGERPREYDPARLPAAERCTEVTSQIVRAL